MIVEKISYQKTFPLAPYTNEKIGIEIQVEKNERVADILDTAKSIVETWHLNNNPQLYQDKTPDIPIIPKSNSINDTYMKMTLTNEESIEDQIKSCTSAAVLKAVYEKIVKGKPELEAVYNLKLKELT